MADTSVGDHQTRTDRHSRDVSLADAREADEVARLRLENSSLRERVGQLEADQAMILDINQMLLAKLHLLSEDFLEQAPGRQGQR